MIINFKIFESINEDKLKEKIYTTLMNYDDGYLSEEEIDKDFPFPFEIQLIHEKEYIKDIFFHINSDMPNLSWKEFKSTYIKMLENVKMKIETAIKNNPTIYNKWENYFDYDILNIPEYIKNSTKYNL